MEGEDRTGAGLRVAVIGEAGDLACAFVNEWQRLVVFEPTKLCGGVVVSLLFVHGYVLCFFQLFGFDYTDRYFVNKQYVIGRSFIGVVFANGNTGRYGKIDLCFFLNSPARCCKHFVNTQSGFLLGQVH